MTVALVFAAQLVAWAVFAVGCVGLGWLAWVLADAGRRHSAADWIRWQVQNRQE